MKFLVKIKKQPHGIKARNRFTLETDGIDSFLRKMKKKMPYSNPSLSSSKQGVYALWSDASGKLEYVGTVIELAVRA